MNELSLFNTLFGDHDYGFNFPDLVESTPSFNMPKVDVKENKDSYVLDMDLPGRSDKDINLELKDKVLTISSHKEETKEEKSPDKKDKDNKKVDENGEWLIRERRTSDFTRRFTLPEDINEEKVNAAFKNGVLTVTIPRKVIAPSAKKIAITAA